MIIFKKSLLGASNKNVSRRLMHLNWVLALLMVTTLGFSQPANSKVIKIATLSPDGTSWMKAMRAGAKEIKQETQGRVIMKFYPGGVMGSDKSVLRKIRIGQLHGGAVTTGSLSSIYSDMDIYG